MGGLLAAYPFTLDLFLKPLMTVEQLKYLMGIREETTTLDSGTQNNKQRFKNGFQPKPNGKSIAANCEVEIEARTAVV